MRLWHWEILHYLPDSQLIAQYRELGSIYKKQNKHILINYVYEYSKHDLLVYSLLVLSEIQKRGFRTRSTTNFDSYFEGVYLKDIDYEHYIPFKNHQTDRYLLQCFFNLQEKYDRGQKDFSASRFEALKQFVCNTLNKKYYVCHLLEVR